MKEVNNILSDTFHRPFELPNGKWLYYQEWNKVLFFHWTIPIEILRECVPGNFNIDTCEGKCYISLVAFTMQKIRPRYLPSFALISDFNEINLRTYIEKDNKKGVYFLNIEATKALSNFIAKKLSGLPYEKSKIKRTANTYISTNIKKGYYLDTKFEIKKLIENKSVLDKWLTERYCLYLVDNNEYYRYDIHHKEWEIKYIDIKRLKLRYKVGDLDLGVRNPDMIHFSEGIKVLAWKREKA